MNYLLPTIAKAVVLAMLVAMGACTAPRESALPFTPAERELLIGLGLHNLPAAPTVASNPVADDPRAVRFGQQLFFDKRLSGNGQVACASCHKPEYHFKDDRARSVGTGVTARKSMTVVGTAYSPWLFWDGRRDSLWAQALEPLEDPREHGGNRVEIVRTVLSDAGYRDAYTSLFGPPPSADDLRRLPAANPRGSAEERAAWSAMPPADQHAVATAFANIGRALEAYQRQLQYGPTAFDAFAKALAAGDDDTAREHLTADQIEGAKLFVGQANCIHCHNGPLFTNNEFHNTGLEGPGMLPSDRGRVDGVKMLRADEFNCLGPYSDATEDDCAELRFVKWHGIELVGAFRTVSLRNIAGSGPFMHTGQFATLAEVIDFYNVAQPTIISDELQPLRLTENQKQQLVAFLESLSGPLDAPASLLTAPANAVAAATAD
ncbi:MAG: cytochrome c peroxidase [Oceanococcaceae bacterium]